MTTIPFLYTIQISQGSSLDEVAWLYSMFFDSEALYRENKETDVDFRNRILDHYNKKFSEIKLTTSQCPDNIKL